MQTTLQAKGTEAASLMQGPHFVVVDDDALFGRLLERVAEKEGLHLTVVSSPEEAFSDLYKLKFDVGLFDFDLGRGTGIQLCRLLERVGRTVPVLVVSQFDYMDTREWPASVKQFVPKTAGPYAILAVARKIHEENRRRELESHENTRRQNWRF